MSITKSQACDLFKYDFKLVDKEGNETTLIGIVTNHLIGLRKKKPFEIKFSAIGKDFFILAYHHSCLTKQINGVIPIVELAKVAYPFLEFTLDRFGNCVSKSPDYRSFYFEDSDFWCVNKTGDCLVIGNQPALFDKLYSLHFLPHGIEESNVKWIND